jgi:two-component system sensor histidine kinase DesK
MALGVANPDRSDADIAAWSWAAALATWIVGTVVVCLAVVALLTVLSAHPGPGGVAQAVVYLTTLVLLQLLYFGRRPTRRYTWFTYAVVLVQACLIYLPMLEFGQAWVGMPGFLAGTALLVFPPPGAAGAFVSIVASMAVAQAAFTGSAYDVVYTSVSTVITGLVVYGLTRLAELIGEVQTSRTKLATLAVTEERLRFARDLHDLLGHSISAINRKAELARELVRENPERTERELVELLRIGTQALTDVRAVARGYRELSLEDEAASAESILLAADIDTSVTLDYHNLPVHMRTLLATVLRESVTNVLRHSKAKRCDVVVRQDADAVTMEVVNDGVRPGRNSDDSDAHSGTGVDNLSARVAALGGELEAAAHPGDRFRLWVRVPVSPARDRSAS